jgi:hypothetical protein
VRVPADAVDGDAQATLWFRDSKEVARLTLDFEVR